MLNKKTNVKNGKDQSPKYPPGFTPNDETNDNSGIGDKFVNYNADEGTIEGDGVSVNVNSKGDDVDSVGQTIGYNMEGVVNNLSDIIESHGESLVNR
ncbi:hypothetical protein Tco_0764060 [Tanacetum coccineum]